MKMRSIRACLVLAGIFLGAATTALAAPSPAEIKSLAEEAYIFGYPLVLMDLTEKATTAPPVGAPVNQFYNMREFPDPSFNEVVSPNADTLYSSAWLDLRQEPIVLSKPGMFDRYFLLPFLDAWTNVFDSLSPRTATTADANYAIVGPGWKGALPDGLKRIDAPTNTVWIIGRTYTHGKSDYAEVHKIQDEYKLTPLSAWGKNYTPPPAESSKPQKEAPVDVLARMTAPEFFDKLASLMKENPPATADAPMLAKLGQLGVVPGQAFVVANLGKGGDKALQQGAKAGLAKLISEARGKTANEVNGWAIIGDLGRYGTKYLFRAAVAYFGLGANLPNDALYPKTAVDSDGKPLSGANRYVLHFEKDQIPPAMGFWSLTLYNQRQFFVANPIDRYAIGDRDKLQYNADGSLDLYIQKDSPGPEKESNWLPAPKGGFNLILRLYYPMQRVLQGEWFPPPVKRVP